MVRVISVHHFVGQNVQTVEQPTACCTAPPDRLLLALMNNSIEVRDLKNDSELLFTFPTVDEVSQIIHCLNGDYVATLETKFNRQNKELNFVRVYINWDSVATLQQSKMTSSGVSLGSTECGMVQPMRARIAGRVTPTTNQSELGSLEMIEIPVNKNPHLIATCQVSGNLLILSQNIINIHKFEVKTHDISKIKFIDFTELGIFLELPFEPKKIEMNENFIGAQDKKNMYLFKLNTTKIKSCSTDLLHESLDIDFSCLQQNETIDFEEMLLNEQFPTQKTNKDSFTINLPSILQSNSIIYKHSPFMTCDREMTAKMSFNNLDESKFYNYSIKNLIQLKLEPIIVENATRSITEEFKTFLMQPMYTDVNIMTREKSLHNLQCDLTSNIFKSDYSKHLQGVTLIVATQQEGYMYLFNTTESDYCSDNCIAVYPFTAPIFDLVIEDYFLHALTETGLESYTLRSGHQLCRNVDLIDNINTACPPVKDAICLVGLRPFLGVEQILISQNHLILLANSESSPAHSVSSNSSSTANYWTLYNIELPSPKIIFNDISIVANVHRFSSIQTYRHLMNEAHMILRMALMLKKWSVTEDNVKLIGQKMTNRDDLKELYRNSCALLGDHFIMCANKKEYTLSIPYYKMAKIGPLEVLNRVKKIQEQSNQICKNGLLNYLETILLDVKSGTEIEKIINSGAKQDILKKLLTLMEQNNYSNLPNLILKSKVLRENTSDRIVQILQRNVFDNKLEVNLALTVIHIQKNNPIEAQKCIQNIDLQELTPILLENWELLFETTYNVAQKTKIALAFSELTDLLIKNNPSSIGGVFVKLTLSKKVISLNKLMKLFMDYLPTIIGKENHIANEILQSTLELYFAEYFKIEIELDPIKIGYEKGLNDALKLLIRSYLSQIQLLQLKGDKKSNTKTQDYEKMTNSQEFSQYNTVYKGYFEEKCLQKVETYLFENKRYKYLDKMPPFQIDITSKIYETCLQNSESPPLNNESTPNIEAEAILLKLQAILCSKIVPKAILAEVDTFLDLNDTLKGRNALKSIYISSTEAVILLVDVCPQSLLQFGKDRFTKPDEWKYLIATLQRKILKISQNENLSRICFFYKKLLKDILAHVATTTTLEELIKVFPQRFSIPSPDFLLNNNPQNLDTNFTGYSENDMNILNEIQNYEPFVIICRETMQAKQINKLITATGQQLLTTLNL